MVCPGKCHAKIFYPESLHVDALVDHPGQTADKPTIGKLGFYGVSISVMPEYLNFNWITDGVRTPF